MGTWISTMMQPVVQMQGWMLVLKVGKRRRQTHRCRRLHPMMEMSLQIGLLPSHHRLQHTRHQRQQQDGRGGTLGMERVVLYMAQCRRSAPSFYPPLHFDRTTPSACRTTPSACRTTPSACRTSADNRLGESARLLFTCSMASRALLQVVDFAAHHADAACHPTAVH